MSAPEVIRLFGGPGSGKTTALLNRVDTLLEEGVDVRDILIVSYTRAAAQEIRERMAERLDRSPTSLRGNVSTMHAKAYELLDLSRTDVVGEKHKKAFCEQYGIKFEDEYESSRRHSSRSTTIGNKILDTSEWLQRTNREVADWYEVPFKWNAEQVRLPPDIDPNAQEGNKYTPTWPSDDDRIDVPEAIRGWRSHKGAEGVVGFADMLERVTQRSLLPSVDHLVIDEFQDITTLQYAVYEEWRPHMETVQIAGDDDQVVYAWQGADPNLLLEERVDVDEVLPNSYRLPSQILNAVNREVRHIETRQEKDLRPRTTGGRVEAFRNPSMLELVREVRSTAEADPETTQMILFRARYQMFQFVDEFVSLGIPFASMTDTRLWTDRLQGYVQAIERLEADEPVDGLDTRRLAEMLASSGFGTGERSDLFDAIDERQERAETDDLREIEFSPTELGEYAPFAPGAASAADMLSRVSDFQERSVEAYFGGDYRGMDPNRVRVGTIHSAKGREADHVYLATDLTEKVVEQMAATHPDPTNVTGVEEFSKGADPVPTLTEDERRVFYVGMSRARERLVLMENLVDGAPTLPIDVLTHNAMTETPFEETLSEIREPAEPEGETGTPQADD
jgi:DNA helicase-2/ATP-dependent DNA helicase PcrA